MSKRFIRNTLIAGIIVGAIFFLMIFFVSSGTIAQALFGAVFTFVTTEATVFLLALMALKIFMPRLENVSNQMQKEPGFEQKRVEARGNFLKFFFRLISYFAFLLILIYVNDRIVLLFAHKFPALHNVQTWRSWRYNNVYKLETHYIIACLLTVGELLIFKQKTNKVITELFSSRK